MKASNSFRCPSKARGGVAALAVALLAASACSQPDPPSTPTSRVRIVLDQLQQFSQEGGHGPHHRANNDLQRELWKGLQDLAPGPETERLLLEAAECVYSRYDANYYHGILWHWPYLSSRRAIEVCDRLIQSTKDPEMRERALWIKAFALRCPPVEEWAVAEEDLETYAEQRRWKPDYDASRAVYKTIASEFPKTPRGVEAARLVRNEDLSFMLPKGPKEPDPRDPDPGD